MSMMCFLVTLRLHALALVGHVLRDAVAERPVFRKHLNEVDDDVPRPHPRILREPGANLGIRRLLLGARARVADGELNKNDIGAVADAEILGRVAEVSLVMLADNHETVVLGHVEHRAQRVVNAIEQGLAIGGGLASSERNAGERHVGLLWNSPVSKRNIALSRS